jgi:hypothetical protein
MDPLIIQDLIKKKPETILAKESVVCKYDLDILSRVQKIEVSVPAKTYPSNSSAESLELKRSIQSLKTEVKMLKLVVEKLFLFSFVESKPYPNAVSKISNFGKSFIDAVDFLKLPCSDTGRTFYHHAMSQGWFVEQVQPSFTDINSLDYDGKTALHVFFDHSYTEVEYNNRFDLACKMISAGADCNILDKENQTCLWRLFTTHYGYLNKGFSQYLECSKKFMHILTLMLKKGANPLFGSRNNDKNETLLGYWQKNSINADIIRDEVVKLLCDYGAK